VRRAIVPIAVCALLLAATSQAQAPPGPPKPGPEVKRLGYFVGNWKSTGEMKPGPMGPGGKITATDKFEWLPGGFFVVLHSKGTSSMGPFEGVAYMGYDVNRKVHTYHEFTSTGEAVTSEGTVTGDTWTWTSEEKQGSTVTNVRVTLKEVSNTEYTFQLEMSQNGGAWMTVEESKSTKVTPAVPAKL
jgi:hypothetical protein